MSIESNYMKCPREFTVEPLASALSISAKVLYTILADESEISENNREFQDDDGTPFVCPTVADLAKVAGCSKRTIDRALKELENIDYHLPGIETPLTREIKTKDLLDGKKYQNYLNTHDDQRQAIGNLYKSTNNIHSHLISGPDKTTFDKLVEDLEKIEDIIGINLSNEEIAEITRKKIE